MQVVLGLSFGRVNIDFLKFCCYYVKFILIQNILAIVTSIMMAF